MAKMADASVKGTTAWSAERSKLPCVIPNSRPVRVG